ncbi:MAG: hypothetical protein AAFP87_20455 [Pseudomonadota bacterium]
MTSVFEKLGEIPGADAMPAGAISWWRRALCGHRARCQFIVSEDEYGQIEISLSVEGLRRPTDGHVRAFFRWLEVEPLYEDPRAVRFTRHFVMPPETTH